MKMKIILLILFFGLIVFISYLYSENNDINYTILGDKEIFSNNLKSVNFADLVYKKLEDEKVIGFYSKDFIKENIRTIDITNDINDNLTIDNISIQNILKRTDMLIISIGNNEINYKLSKNDDDLNNENEIYKYLDTVIIDVENLVQKIEILNKSEMIFLGYYNDTNNSKNDKYYKYINKKLQKVLEKRNIIFIDLFNILNKNEDYLTSTTPVYITNEGNLAIYNKIVSEIDKLDLHKRN